MHPSGAADVLRTYRRAAGCDGKHHVSAFSNLLQQFVQVFQSCLGRSASQLLSSMVLTSILVLVKSIVVVLTNICGFDKHSAGFSIFDVQGPPSGSIR